MKTIEELRKFETAGLLKELDEMLKKLFKIKFDLGTEQSKNNHLVKKYRGQVARIKTLLKEKMKDEPKEDKK